jgi:hypothetical protein
MHPRIEEVTSQLALRRAQLDEALAQLPRERWSERPAAGGWTMAELVDHRRVVVVSCTRVIRKLMQKIRDEGLGAERETGALLPVHGPVAMIVDRARKFEAPPFVAPGTDPDPAAAYEGLLATRVTLLDTLREADGMALSAVTRPHPVVGPIDGYGWALSVAEHEARHTEQAREIIAGLG